MKCASCGADPAIAIRASIIGGTLVEGCYYCAGIRPRATPDVYFSKPYFDSNLADAQNPHGVMIHSKRHKAHVMSEQGVREDGDKYHGAREKGARLPKRDVAPEFKKKLRTAIRKNLGLLKRRP